MGISKAVSIPAVLIFAIAFSLRNRASPVVLFPLIHCALTGFIVAFCSHPSINYTPLFKKKEDGTFSWWSYLCFHHYLWSVQTYVKWRRLKSTEPVYNEICDGLFVGGWPIQPKDVPPGNPAVLDCTCELPKARAVKGLPYKFIPAWDSRSPSPKGIETGIRWALQKRSQKHPIYIHCAFGHGRSVTVMCALLIALGVVETCKEAEDMVRRYRPRIRMNKIQRENLRKWKEQYR